MSTMTTLSFLALSNILSFAFANPVAPAAPVITPRAVLPRQLLQRQDPASSAASSSDISVDPEDGWIGYYQNTDTDVSTAYTSLYCGGSSIFTTSTYSGSTIVGCCIPGYCTTDLALTCTGSSAVYSDESGSTSGWACSTNSCNADTIYMYSTADPNEAMLWWGCNDFKPRFYFQEEPANAEVVATSDLPDSSTLRSSSSQPSSTSKAPSQTGSAAPAITPAPKGSSSKAWIAGVVVGVVSLFAIAGLAFWLLRNRKKNKDTEYKPAPQGVAQVYPTAPPQGYSPGYMGDQQQPQQGFLGDVQQQQNPTAYQHQDAKGYFSPPPPGMQSPQTAYQDPHASAYYGQNGAPAQVHPHYSEGPSEMPGSSPTGAGPSAPAELPEQVAPTVETAPAKTN